MNSTVLSSRYFGGTANALPRPIDSGRRHTSTVGNVKIALSEKIALLLHPHVDIPFSLVVKVNDRVCLARVFITYKK